MADECNIGERLGEACNGHPYALIPWPHYLLHDAIDEIERLRVALRESTEVMRRVPVDLAISPEVKRQIAENVALLSPAAQESSNGR